MSGVAGKVPATSLSLKELNPRAPPDLTASRGWGVSGLRNRGRTQATCHAGMGALPEGTKSPSPAGPDGVATAGRVRLAEMRWPRVCLPDGRRLARAKKKPRTLGPGFRGKCSAMTYSCMRMHTTIGAVAFHFRVRDGIGWFHNAIVTEQAGEAARWRLLASMARRGCPLRA